ncbi:MAG: MBL fold metallo-hydrolase [Longimicrobiales bacterium]
MAANIFTIDLGFRGWPRAVASCLLDGDAPAIVDPGPASTLGALRNGLAQRGLSVGDLETILLTHIHLDHAGATGTLVRENPRIQVYVHERGAPHVIDPSRLIDSARRLYGELMDPVFGELLPVPSENVVVLRGGERLDLGGRIVDVTYSPGHAKHHVAYIDDVSGTAFVGDTAGVRDTGLDHVLPVTPPPDIDLDGWIGSLDRIAAWQPQQLFLTHFGPAAPVPEHLAQFRERLDEWSTRVRASLAEPGDDDTRAQRFAHGVGHELSERLGDRAIWYEEGAEPAFSWHGLARYWRNRG